MAATALPAGAAATAAAVASPAVTAAAATPATACAEAPPTPVTTGAAFNNPAAGDATGVVEQICSLVTQAPAGSQIRLAHFVISGSAGMDFTNVLLAARDRGVDVQVVLDGWQVANPASVALIEGLGQDESADSWVHVCGNVSPEGNTSSCIGTKGQHNKFYLFSETGGAKNVVVQSSANFTDVNSRTYWNNAVVLPGNHRLYDAYNAYFEDLAAEVQDPDYYRQVATAGPGGPVTAHFFPSADTDPALERLTELGCKNNGTTEIRVGMSEWDTTRLGIADRLVEMAESGCTVRVVHGPMDQEVADTLTAAGIELRALNSGTLPGRIHSKYLVVDGATGTRSGGQLVLTGSPNFNTTSLHRNDETMLELRDKGIYEQYEENFETMWAAAAQG
ncbi:phosphatidylserine/phosphatidylglycerophosphate/cardiolipin synthase family protein [Georgenia ruanii]|uniref:phospholipase D n=1 Tax=Georgenia ruanii TaxID=348442 RepID=A0A7J9UXA6_9MICO|nr:phosphatidylserine/phosphatidylglycerophosphate/cardiolipin synthase family protein [Georgenia ruanii]